ncbi:hypothetical protein [Pseudoduganella sp. OTU4001]|uniref:hypothetical protein n=1 Tax=Pseudoduganella sp. OTU4001 TaxID=3043854 RepID=UPI00313C6B7E
MLDNHSKITAVLHIIMGAFLLLTLIFFTLFFGGMAALAHAEVPFIGWLAGLGAFIAGLFALYGVGQIAAAISYLNGSAIGRTFLIIFSVISLFNFPIGTAAGGYSLWALLRK